MTTINQEEIQKFSKIADEWWDAEGKFKPLHRFNPIRIKYIIDKCSVHFNLKNNEDRQLSGLKFLDIGCGGGLVSEPLSRLGASVTGIDASSKNIEVAKIHAKKNNLKINYICSSPEKLNTKKKYDVILNMEVVEHVENLEMFIKSSSSLLKKNGIMFIATINKTLKSYIFAIVGAEYILNWLPVGTHDWFKFVEPTKLKLIGKKNNLEQIETDGLKYNILRDKWYMTRDTNVNYICKFTKV